MKTDKLQEKIDLIKNQLNELLIRKPENYRDEIYRICSCAENYVLSLHSPEMENMVRMCDVDRRERKYMTNTVYDLISEKAEVEPIMQLKLLSDKVFMHLCRIEERFSNQDIDESIQFFLQYNISADYINVMIDDFIDNKEYVLYETGKRLQKREQLYMALRIYSILYEKYEKAEYAISAAFIYMQLSRNDLAVGILETIKNPTSDVEELINKLSDNSGGI